MAVGVGVQRRGEPALGQRHVAQQVVERLLRDDPVPLLAGRRVRVQVGRGQQGVVVEHLLEVRHQPSAVHRVAGEAAGQYVVHPPGRHPVQRRRHHRRRLGIAAPAHPQQELERAGGRELGRAAEAAPLGVERRADRAGRGRQRRLGERAVGRAQPAGGGERRGHPPGGGHDLALPLAVGVGHRDQHLAEGGHAHPRLGRVVGAAVERLAVGREEHRHRPTAVAGHADDGVHVDRVDVGTLLAIDLDVHEQAVHQRRGLVVLERLVRHHVAPVARGVADREQDRPVGVAGGRARLVAPRVPVDRVAGVLEQVRAGLAAEPVHSGRVPDGPAAGITPRPGGSGAP